MQHISDPDHAFNGSSSRRVVVVGVDRKGFTHAFGSMSTAPTNSLSGPPDEALTRYEVLDTRLRVWVAAPGRVTAALRRLTPEKRRVFLVTHRHGVREVLYGGEPDVDDDKALDKALKLGLLTMGHRTFRLSVSPTGNIRLKSASGTLTYSREALLDVIRRKSL